MKKRYKLILWLLLIVALLVIIVNIPFLTLRFKTNIIANNVDDAPGQAPQNTYPLILLHGFNPTYSRRLSEFSLYGLQDDLAKDLNYTNKKMFAQNMTCAQLRYSEKPIIIRATYFSRYDLVEIPIYAENLNAIIERVTYCTGAEKVDIIAHSMGGIVTRYYLEHTNATNIRKLIMLATPNHGKLYNLGKVAEHFIDNGSSKFALDFLQLSEDTVFMQSLGNKQLENVEVYTVAGNSDGKGDGLIFADSPALKDIQSKENKHIEVPCGHIEIKHPKLCPEMYAFVKEALLEN